MIFNHVEVGKFDVQKMMNPTIQGTEYQEDNILWKWMQARKKLPKYKETVFMNVIRRKVLTRYLDCHVTYGSITTPNRKELGLEKSHYNDAIAISGLSNVRSNPSTMFKIVQFRKKKRSLHEATARKGRKQKNITAKRNEKNKICRNNNWQYQ